MDGGTNLDVQDEQRLSGAARVGGDLRAARERLGWTIEQMAQGLRIRLPYLQALEVGRLSDLPGEAYAVGFMRTYASALGLDPVEMIRRMRAEMTAPRKRPDLVFPAPVPERGVPAGAIVLLSVLLAAGAYVGWYRLSGEGRLPPETVAPVPERLAPLADQAIPPGPDTPPSAPLVVAPVAAPAPVAVQVTPPPVVAVPVDPDASRLTLRATGDVWIGVRDKAQMVYQATLHAGEVYAVSGKPGLTLSIGNASRTDLLVDGVQAPGLRTNAGLVRTNLAVDPDTIRDGKWPGQGETPMTKPAAPKPAASADAGKPNSPKKYDVNKAYDTQ